MRNSYRGVHLYHNFILLPHVQNVVLIKGTFIWYGRYYFCEPFLKPLAPHEALCIILTEQQRTVFSEFYYQYRTRVGWASKIPSQCMVRTSTREPGTCEL